MDLTNIKTIKNVLKKHKLWAKKSLGQYFLIDKKSLENVINSADLDKSDTVLEVGPGIGTLTSELFKKAKKVIAIEKDPVMSHILKENAAEVKKLKIIEGDILKINLQKELPRDYKVVSNIPFNITSPLIRYFLEAQNKPREIVLTIQKEVAEKICAKPGNMSILAIAVQFYAKPEIAGFISKKSFWPVPKVDSAIIKIVPRVTPWTRDIYEKEFFRLVRIGFSSPRKQLINNLAAGFQIPKEKIVEILKKAEISSHVRAQDLSLGDWLDLYKIFNEYDIL